MNKIIISLFLVSCTPSFKYTQLDCENASLNCFMGQPTECFNLKNKCDKFTIEYTKEKCQKAFNSLIFGMSKSELEKNYGDRILKCFSDDQKEKFLRN